MREREPLLELSPEKLLAKKAANIMIGASRQEPASITRQGAVIALICKREGMENPTVLKEAIINDAEEIDRVHAQALEAHKKLSKKIGREIPPVTREKTKSIIESDFFWAEMLSFLPPEEIQTVLAYKSPANSENLRRIHAAGVIKNYLSKKQS